MCLRIRIQQSVALDFPTRHGFQNFADAAGNYLAERTILFHETRLLLEQNNEKTARQSSNLRCQGKRQSHPKMNLWKQCRGGPLMWVQQVRAETDGVLEARSLVKEKDRVQMSWILARLRSKRSGSRSIVLSYSFDFAKLFPFA